MWFASNLLFLHYQSQHSADGGVVADGCDLLRIYYFCTINHSYAEVSADAGRVVICFEFIIFALSITAKLNHSPQYVELWFASNLLFLHYQSQLVTWENTIRISCDLLRIYYFCTINHSYTITTHDMLCVVICFEFIIFALSITAWSHLKHQTDRCDLLRIYYFCTINHSLEVVDSGLLYVVICFEFIIFALSITAYRIWFYVRACCDLLRIYYFCTINHSNRLMRKRYSVVVICFEFIIFALSITAHMKSHWSSRRCDLLRIYYFCTINHSHQSDRDGGTWVVICFEFIIFALSITAMWAGWQYPN